MRQWGFFYPKQWRGGREPRRRIRPWLGSQACSLSPPGEVQSPKNKASLSQQGSGVCEAQFLRRKALYSYSYYIIGYSFHYWSELTLREPLVFEAVERVKEALVNKICSGGKNLDREEGEHLALKEEDDFHHDGEHCVRNHHRYWQVHQGPTLGGSVRGDRLSFFHRIWSR